MAKIEKIDPKGKISIYFNSDEGEDYIPLPNKHFFQALVGEYGGKGERIFQDEDGQKYSIIVSLIK